MFKNTETFSSFSVDDIAKAKAFYGDRLGLDLIETPQGLALRPAGGGEVFIYPKKDHQPATFTVLNFKVKDIDQSVSDLAGIGITLESFGGDMQTDEKGIFRGKGSDPQVAWFRDPAGNYLSVIELASQASHSG
ncbi:MAG: hypothetical protein QUS14_03405 [Pyrinomonadaceae bacterium]|nr:hypothetical protein [Pyrinomonadaceae bacterium]